MKTISRFSSSGTVGISSWRLTKHAVLASCYVATIIGCEFYLTYSGVLGIGVTAAAGAFLVAIVSAPLFIFARLRLSEILYFSVHLAVGIIVNALATPFFGGPESLRGYLISPGALGMISASMSAWIYVFLFVPRSHESISSGVKLTLLTKMACLGISGIVMVAVQQFSYDFY